MANFYDILAEATTDLKEQVRQIILRLNSIADPQKFVYAAAKSIFTGPTFNDTTFTASTTLTAEDIEITTVGKGVIMKSPNGNRWRLTPSNAGASVWTAL